MSVKSGVSTTPHSVMSNPEVQHQRHRARLVGQIYECRCNGRLQTKRSTRLSHTGLVVELTILAWPRGRPESYAGKENRKKRAPTFQNMCFQISDIAKHVL
jgi:hypothetical protein